MKTLINAAASRKGFAFLAAAFVLVLAGYHDIYRPFYSAPGPDIVVVYNALLINDGLPQNLHDHPGYIQYLLYGAWFYVLKFAGLISAARFSDFSSDQTFERDFAALVFASRWLSTLMVLGLAVMIHTGLRFLKVGSYTAFLLSALILTSPGFVFHTLILRVDLPAALFTVAAFFLLLAAVNGRNWQRCYYLAGCALCYTLALSVKTQVIPLLLAFPVIAIAFGKPASDGFSDGNQPKIWRLRPSHGIAFIAVSIGFSVPVFSMLAAQIVTAGKSGVYQLATAGYFMGCAYVYCRLYGISHLGFLVGLAALCLGFSAGLYIHQITQSQTNGFAIANFIEHMLKLSTYKNDIKSNSGDGSLLMGILPIIPDLLGRTVKDAFFTFSTEHAFRLILYYLVIIGTVMAFYFRKTQIGLQCLLLVLTAFGMQAFCLLKKFDPSYFAYVSPWLVIAVAILVSEIRPVFSPEKLPEFGKLRILLIALIAVLGMSALSANTVEAFKERTWKPPVNACKRAPGSLPLMKHYFERYCETNYGSYGRSLAESGQFNKGASSLRRG